MVRLDLSYFYRLGVDFATARSHAPDQKMIGVWLALDQLRNRVRQVLGDPTVGRSLRGAFGVGSSLVTYIDTLTDRSLDDAYTVYDRNSFINKINEFEIVLASELSVADAYFVLEKKPFSTLTLVSEGEALFPLDLPRKVPEAVGDLREAGKCLAFELPTAAAFHLHRTIESVLRRYWKQVSQGQASPRQRTIGVYLAALKKHNLGDTKVIAALEQIKDLHRNVIIHPEETLTSEEAVSLVGIANSVTSAMLKELPFVESDPPAPDDQTFPEDPVITDNDVADELR